MILYAIIMFAVAIVFGAIAVLIYKGKTDLIHNYHQTKVSDKASYGKAFGKALGILVSAMLVSGIIALLGEEMMLYAVGALIIGLIDGWIAIVRVQKKYNGGVF